MQLARAVGGHDHGGALARDDRPDLGDRDLEVREQLEQERLELVVGAVELVDQQHDRLLRLDRVQQRPAHEKAAVVEVGSAPSDASPPRIASSWRS